MILTVEKDHVIKLSCAHTWLELLLACVNTKLALCCFKSKTEGNT